jgi:hypothetical protein
MNRTPQRLPLVLLAAITLVVSSPSLTGSGSAGPRDPASGPGSAPALGCDPAPCVLRNVLVSSAPYSLPDSLAVNPADTRELMTAQVDLGCTTVLHSSDGGATWEPTCGPHDLGLEPDAAYGPDGTAYLVGWGQDRSCAPDCDENVGSFSRSTDNGATWSPVVAAVPHTLGFGVQGFDLAVDDTFASPHYRSIYVSSTQVSGLADSTISVSRSIDGGSHWTTVNVDAQQTPPLHDDFSHLAIAGDGTVYVTWMRCSQDAFIACPARKATMFLSRSTDGGATWTRPAAIATTDTVPANPACPNHFAETLPNSCWVTTEEPVIAVDDGSGPFAGSLYVVYYRWTGTFMQVVLISSRDGGTTWTAPVPVAPASDTHDQFAPDVAVSAGGVVGVTWQDRRRDPANVEYEAFAGFSRDGGSTVPRNVRLASAPSDPSGTDFGRAYPVAGAWAGRALVAIWQDTRTGAEDVVFGGAQPG